MAAPIGALHAEITADSARFQSETDKAIAKAKETARRMESSFRKSSKASGGFAKRTGRDSKVIRDRFTNMEATVTASSAAMRSFGVQGNDAINTITSSLTQMVAGGLGPWSLAIGVALTSLQFFIAGMKEAETEADRLKKRLQDPTSTESLEKRRESARANALARQLKVSTEEARIIRQQIDLREQLARAEARVVEEQAKGATAAAIERREASVTSIEARLVDLESRRKLAEQVRKLEEGLARDTIARGSESVAERTRKLNEDLARLFERAEQSGGAVGSALAAGVDPALARVESRVQSLRDQLRELESGGTISAGELALIRQIEQAKGEATSAEASFEREAAEARVRALEEELDLMRRIEGARLDLAAARSAAQREGRDAGEQRAGEHDRLTQRLIDAEADLAFEIAQIDRSETERRVAEFRRRHETLIEEARRAGLDVARLEALVSERATSLAAPSRPAAAERESGDQRLSRMIESDRFGMGFEAELVRMRLETQSLGELGAGTARDLRNGFSSIFEGALHGADELKRRLDNLSDQLQSRLVQFGFDRLLGAGLRVAGVGATSSFDNFGGSTDLATPDNPYGFSLLAEKGLARGGSFKVGGVGPVDSKLIAFRATPGELIEATPPGRARPGGGETRVIVENPTAAPATTERRRRADGGEDVMVMFERSAARSIRQGGELDKAIREKYGLHRGTRRR